MALSDDLSYTSAADLARFIRDREASPIEIVNAVIDRIEERDPSLNAFVFKGYDNARARAKAATDAVMSGAELGPLHGVPTAIKDLFDFKPGWTATLGGVKALATNVVDAYCLFAERVERDGAIIVGKTNSPVMGFRGTCDNYLFGPSCNPFDTTKNTGGSSGGSAAAVADGLVPFAEGSDAGGSIRIPAAWCGLFGMMASWGRVPVVIRPDAFAGTSPFVAEGPLTRTVADAALVLQTLSGYDARDPYSLTDTPDFVAALKGDLTGRRIAYSADFGVYPVDPRVAAVVADSVLAFEAAGAIVEEVGIPIPYDQRELSDLWCRLITPLNIRAFEGFKATGLDMLRDNRNSFPPEYLRWIDAGYHSSVTDLIRDEEMRTVVFDAIQRVFETYDFLVTPTLAAVQVDNATDGNTIGPRTVAGVEVDPLIGWCMTYFTNFSGHPAASIPAGLIDARLPVGMQIIGRRQDDAGVLTASSVFEQLRPWDAIYQLCRERSIA
jgi:amidase